MADQSAPKDSTETWDDQPVADQSSNAGHEASGGTDAVQVTYLLRDRKPELVKAFEETFSEYPDRVQVSEGDIFQGAPAADAIVSPANSFGFMDGGIDMAYSRYFGWDMSKRLQDDINNLYDGELLVGQAHIVPTYSDGETPKVKAGCVGDLPIRLLISAPTMRVPEVVANTPNAYLAFRAVILAVQKYNSNADNEPIRRVLCPGLGTNIGQMPPKRAAEQMLEAFKLYDLREWKNPQRLDTMWLQHDRLIGGNEPAQDNNKCSLN